MREGCLPAYVLPWVPGREEKPKITGGLIRSFEKFPNTKNCNELAKTATVVMRENPMTKILQIQPIGLCTYDDPRVSTRITVQSVWKAARKIRAEAAVYDIKQKLP